MLKFFVSTAVDLTICALSLAVFLSLLGRLNKTTALKSAVRSLLLTVVIAFVFACVKHNTRLINQELVNIAVLSAACIGALYFIISLSLQHLRGGAAPRGGIFTFVDCLILSLYACAVLFYVLPEYFLDPTDFVLSNQSVFSTEFLFRGLGWLAGSLLMLLLAVASFYIVRRLGDTQALVFSCLIVAVGFIAHGSTLLQLLLARRIIPFNRSLFAYVKFAINNADVFILAALIITFIPCLLLLWRYRLPLGTFANPALRRKALAFVKRGRRLSVYCALLLVLTTLDITVGKAYLNRGFTLSPAESYELDDTYARIPLTQISDRHLHRFEYQTSDGITVRFIIIQKQGSSFGVGYDACEICGATGYYERNGQVVCMLCDVVMNINTIGYKGGCNPIPLPYSIEEGALLIERSALEVEKRRFR